MWGRQKGTTQETSRRGRDGDGRRRRCVEASRRWDVGITRDVETVEVAETSKRRGAEAAAVKTRRRDVETSR